MKGVLLKHFLKISVMKLNERLILCKTYNDMYIRTLIRPIIRKFVIGCTKALLWQYIFSSYITFISSFFFILVLKLNFYVLSSAGCNINSVGYRKVTQFYLLITYLPQPQPEFSWWLPYANNDSYVLNSYVQFLLETFYARP